MENANIMNNSLGWKWIVTLICLAISSPPLLAIYGVFPSFSETFIMIGNEIPWLTSFIIEHRWIFIATPAANIALIFIVVLFSHVRKTLKWPSIAAIALSITLPIIAIVAMYLPILNMSNSA